MVTVNERPVTAAPEPRLGLLNARVERDLSDFLAEYGAGAEDTANHARPVAAHAITLAYGIPMPGVRYYTFAPER